MTDMLISFEVAKLAKEKGFNWPTAKAYDKCDMLCTYNPERDLNYNTSGYIKSAPTQSLLQKWLRDVCKVVVTIKIYHTGTYTWELHKFKEKPESWNRSDIAKTIFLTYEEALEDGLINGLKLI